MSFTVSQWVAKKLTSVNFDYGFHDASFSTGRKTDGHEKGRG